MLTRKSNLVTAVIVGLVGILLIAFHSRIDLLNWVSVAVGLMFVLPSLYVLCSSIGGKQHLPVGIAFVSAGGLILGLLMCIFPDAFAGFFVYLFAAMLVIFGIYQIVDLASWSRIAPIPAFYYVIPVLLVATGIVMLCTSLRNINTAVVLVTGIALIAGSANSLLEYFSTRRASKASKPE